MRSELLFAARAAGRPFVEWTPAGPSVYNPFARGSRSEIADKLLAGERFTEPHYLRQAQRYLGQAIAALHRAGVEVSLAEVVRQLDPANLELLARRLPEREAREVHAYLESLTPRQRSELGGVRDRLAVMAESDVGPWLDPCTPHAARFDLLGALRERAVVYFCVHADRLPLLAQMLGAAIVQDLQSACAALHAAPLPSLVVLDEFSALAAEHVARLFGRARSAGISLVLGTQELSDLRLPGRHTLLETVLGNASAVIAHRQAVPASADLLARLSGTKGAWSSSLSSDGRSTRRRELVPRIAASAIGELARGHAMVAVIAQSRRVQLARMYSPNRAG
jgi:type IV secretory pathway TraG/TraD family ATPase VirD4